MLEINKVFLLGNLTRDPDVRYLPSGTMVTEFDLAVNRSYKDKSGEYRQDTLFIRIESMGRLAEFVSEYLKKGRKVYVEGTLKMNAWEGKDGQRRQRILVHGNRIQFADPKPRDDENKQEESSRRPAQEKQAEDKEDKEDENSLPSIDVDEDRSETENDLPF